jgi:hypothetical protein
MEGAKIDEPITIRVPYEPTTALHDMLKPFCDEIDANANSTDLVYQVRGLRLTDLVLALHYATPPAAATTMEDER